MKSKSILISIQPKWVEKILNGAKTIEVRKTRPTLEAPFKCYIYCTKIKRGEAYLTPRLISKQMQVIGEFTCDRIYKTIAFDEQAQMYLWGYDFIRREACLSASDMNNYGKGKTLYGWNITDLKIYDKPKELSEFYTKNLYTNIEKMFTDEKRLKNGLWVRPIKRQPQSWCYVEEE